MVEYLLQLGPVVAIYVVLAVSLNLVMGSLGILTVAQAAFMAFGAYATALLAVDYGWPVIITVPVGMLIAGALGGALAIPVVRITGLLYAVVSFAFMLVVSSALVNADAFTHGAVGVPGIPRVNLGFGPITETWMILTIYGSAALGAMALHWLLRRSRFGLQMLATRENPSAASAAGVDPGRTRLIAFIISAALAALAGSLYASLIRYVDPTPFSVHLSFLIITMLVIGGIGNVIGAALGATVLTLLPNAITFLNLSSTTSGALSQIIYAGIVIAILRLRPQGLLPEGRWRQFRSAPSHRPSQDPTRLKDSDVKSEMGQSTSPPEIGQLGGYLEVRGVWKHFGGLIAVQDVTFDVRPGELVGIIGANGAGKSTLMNLMSGFLKPDRGTVRFRGRDVSVTPTHEWARFGIARTFQDMALFGRLSVMENVVAYLPSPTPLSTPETDAAPILDSCQLASQADVVADDLSYGEQKMLAIARVVASGREVVMLDEPFAGLSSQYVDRTIDLVTGLRRAGKTVIIVDHNVEALIPFVERLVVLDHGRMIADDLPAVVTELRAVQEAYLGV